MGLPSYSIVGAPSARVNKLAVRQPMAAHAPNEGVRSTQVFELLTEDAMSRHQG